MTRLVFIGTSETQQSDACVLSQDDGFSVAVLPGPEALACLTPAQIPDLVLLDVATAPHTVLRECVRQCRDLHLPVIALVPESGVGDFDVSLGVDDFLVVPAKAGEPELRIRQVLWRIRGLDARNVIKVGDLAIDTEKYEVSVAGRYVLLTFKEYELLRLLASSPGRVYSREALLRQVWGYDYYGGTRTVDVHVRRLRTKLEDAEHSFIETIWNVGYRLKATD